MLSRKRLDSAGVLLASLAGEAGRWDSTASELEQDLAYVLGHVALASACVSHMGPFSEMYRSRLLKEWLECCAAAGVSVVEGFSLQHVLSSGMETRSWWLQVRPPFSLPYPAAGKLMPCLLRYCCAWARPPICRKIELDRWCRGCPPTRRRRTTPCWSRSRTDGPS